MKRYLLSFLLLTAITVSYSQDLRQEALAAMKKSTSYFRHKVATHGGYLYKYSTDFTLREGEEIATPTMIWIQPPGTPAVGMVYLKAYQATGDTIFLNGAIEAARALVWGQLASGGWDHPVEFDPERSKKWFYKRDLQSGDTVRGRRRNYTSFDDDVTQSALRFLIRTDKVLKFKDKEIHEAAMYCLRGVLKSQYPNGAWPHGYSEFPDPAKYPVKKARYPEYWSKTFPAQEYNSFYTLNDNCIDDIVETLLEAYKTYGDERYLDAVKKCGDFVILAQMPEPQPAWAQQYNTNMEPAWARKFEPPAITGGESFSAMRLLINVYLNTGDKKYLEPIPKALDWAKRSVLPNGKLARFYELQTNRPLYFNAPRRYSNLPAPAFPDLPDYTLIYEDTDLPNHYSFQSSAEPIKMVGEFYNKVISGDRKKILAEMQKTQKPSETQVREIISTLDDQGRWIEKGTMQVGTGKVETDVISCRTFNSNLSALADFVAK